MHLLTVISIIFSLLSLYSFFKIIQCTFQAKIFHSVRYLIATFIFATFAALFFLIHISLNQWTQAEFNQKIATVIVGQGNNQNYCVHVNLLHNKNNVCHAISGDQWIVTAQIVQFKAWLRYFGFGPFYRFGIISGLYNNIQQENTKKKTAYNLQDRADFDLWKIIKNHPTIASYFISYQYGSAVFMPLIPNAKYDIYLSSTGLVAKKDK